MRIGIDLGTSNSLGVLFRDGKPELIPNQFGSFLTPSVVSLTEDGEVLVGAIAKERLLTAPDRTVSSFKKAMGSEASYLLGRQRFSPEQLSSFVLASILRDAEQYTGEKVTEVVISVPAYFYDRQRSAVRHAGELAGVTVKRLVNEPSAAALAAYREWLEGSISHAVEDTPRFLIFDFGGGTLDVSIVECVEEIVQIVAVAGDNQLGGDDFDACILDSFLAEHSLSKASLPHQTLAALLKEAEKTKIKLSSQPEASLIWELDGRHYESRFDQERLIDAGSGLFQRMRRVLENALKSGDFRAEDMERVVLVGGSSQMPAVQSFLRYLFGQEAFSGGDGQEMIVRGLGSVLGIISRDQAIRNYVLTDICPFTLGTATHNRTDAENPYMSPVIPKNFPLPGSKTCRYYTVSDNQTNIRLKVLQGEGMYARDNRLLGEFRLTLPPDLAGHQSVDVRFSYDINGLLEVDATVVSTGESVHHLYANELSQEEIQKGHAILSRLKQHPKERAENLLLKEKLLAAYVTAGPKLRNYLIELLQQFEVAMDKQEERELRKLRKLVKAALSFTEQYDPFAKTISDALPEADDEDDDGDDDDDDAPEKTDREETETPQTETGVGDNGADSNEMP